MPARATLALLTALLLAPADWGRQAEEADADLAAGRYADAKRLYLELRQAEPHNVSFALSLGITLHRLDETSAAEVVLLEVLGLDPGNQTAARELATIRHRRDGADKTDAYFGVLMASDPSNGAHHYHYLLALDDARRYADLARQAQMMLQKSPQHVGALNQMAIALTHLQRFPEAEKILRHALRLQIPPEEWNVPVLQAVMKNNLARVLARQNKHQEVEVLYREAMRHSPSDAIYPYHLSLWFSERGKTLDAEFWLKRARLLDAKVAEAPDRLIRLAR